jgi:hypothetical protein
MVLRISMAFFAASLFVGCTALDNLWQSQGRADAERDIEAGKLGQRTFGLSGPDTWKYRDMAKAKYGIEFEVVAGCAVDERTIARTKGYNEVMDREIERRYGRDALTKLSDEASELYQKEREAAEKAKR